MDKQKQRALPKLLLSQEMDEIVGRPPHWLIRWGTGLILAVLLMVVALSLTIRYPETIDLPVSIQPASGKTAYIGLIRIHPERSDNIRTGQPVLLRLTAFSYELFGSIKGKIDAI